VIAGMTVMVNPSFISDRTSPDTFGKDAKELVAVVVKTDTTSSFGRNTHIMETW
tara:strand:- start:729 stop:890 length:162 start_codon:yes stop_codon:yes gene_type:complete